MKKLQFPSTLEELAEVTGSFNRLCGKLAVEEDGKASFRGACVLEAERMETEDGVCRQRGALLAKENVVLDGFSWLFEEDGGEYEVYTQYNGWQNESMGGWQPLQTGVVAESRSARVCSGAAPFLVLWNLQTGRGRAFHLLANGAWQMQAARVYLSGDAAGVRISLGLHPKHFRRSLAPGEQMQLPEVLTYEVRNRLDMDAYKLHRYFHQTEAPRPLPVIYNTWLACFDKVSVDFVCGQIPRAVSLGAEYFVVDAGWFGKGESWWTCVGDWEENQTGGFYGRMTEVADAVRKAGMKFGFWLETERANSETETYRAHPEYFLRVGENCMLDFGNPDAFRMILKKVVSLVKKYGAEFLKMDFNVDFYEDLAQAGFTKYAEGYQAFIAALRAEFPGIYIEGCASGGLRMCMRDATLFDSFWPSDCQSPLTGMRIYKESLRRLPPTLYEKWATITSENTDTKAYPGYPSEKLIASHDAGWGEVAGVLPCYLKGFLTGGPIGFSCDVNKLSEDTVAHLAAFVSAFKEDRAYWQRVECRILCDTETITVLQYSDREGKDVRIQVFCERCLQRKVQVYPILPKGKRYKLGEEEYAGETLEAEGFPVPIEGSHRMVEIRLREKN